MKRGGKLTVETERGTNTVNFDAMVSAAKEGAGIHVAAIGDQETIANILISLIVHYKDAIKDKELQEDFKKVAASALNGELDD